MKHTANELRSIMQLNKTTYAGLLGRGMLFCDHPSSKRGVSSKYTKSNVLKNLLLAELIGCGLGQKVAYDLAEGVSFKESSVTFSVGLCSLLTVNLDSIKKLYEVRNERKR